MTDDSDQPTANQPRRQARGRGSLQIANRFALAHLVYAGGDLDRAIELQEKAVKFAGSQAAEIEPFLEKLRTEKSKKEEKDK